VNGYAPINVMGTTTSNQLIDSTAFNTLDHNKTDNNWDMTALARYTANAQYDIEFGAAHKVRSPNMYERYTWSTWSMAGVMNNFVGDGNGYVGDVNLKPEQANTLSATFDWHDADSRWGVKVTPYYTKITDYIDARYVAATPLANKFNVLKYVNQTARIYGFDLSGHMVLAESGWGEWGATGLLNYTNGKNETTGDGLYNIMPLNSKLALNQKMDGWNNSAELVLVQAKTTVSATRNEIKTPGYGLVNLRGSYAWKQVSVNFGVENLLNKFYYLPTGGAYTGQGTTMSINPPSGNYPQWGTAVPGMGRSIYTGLNYKF